MNRDDLQGTLASGAEFVGHIGWADHDVASGDFERVLSHGEGALSFQDHEDLGIGMEMEFGTLIRGSCIQKNEMGMPP
jgi:hypothetical protein